VGIPIARVTRNILMAIEHDHQLLTGFLDREFNGLEDDDCEIVQIYPDVIEISVRDHGRLEKFRIEIKKA